MILPTYGTRIWHFYDSFMTLCQFFDLFMTLACLFYDCFSASMRSACSFSELA